MPVTGSQRRKADHHEDALPEATDAVQVAEAFLRRKYHHRLGNLRSRLQALGSLLASKLHRARLIPSAGVKSRRERT